MTNIFRMIASLSLKGEDEQKDNLLSVIRKASPDIVLDFSNASVVFNTTTRREKVRRELQI